MLQSINQSINQSIIIYPIGIDIENQNNHFINLNLDDYGRIFGDDILFDTLDKLPTPDLIIASPPCESWSIASAMWGGNASWKQETGAINRNLSKFTIRSRVDYDLPHVQFKYDSSFIKRYNPKVFVIENPASSKIWHYINDILNFNIPYDNLTYYSNYGYPIQKPTKFKSNINLNLNSARKKADKQWGEFSKNYNERSNIPIDLILNIYRSAEKALKETLIAPHIEGFLF